MFNDLEPGKNLINRILGKLSKMNLKFANGAMSAAMVHLLNHEGIVKSALGRAWSSRPNSQYSSFPVKTIDGLKQYNAHLDEVFATFDPSATGLVGEFSLEALELVAEYGVVSSSVSGGHIFGGSLGLSLDKSGLSFNWGVGLGVGAGASVTVGGQFGESHKTNLNLDAGNGVIGGTFTGGLDYIFDSISQGASGSYSSGSQVPVHVGVGYGIGLGASVTTGGSVNLISFR